MIERGILVFGVILVLLVISFGLHKIVISHKDSENIDDTIEEGLKRQ